MSTALEQPVAAAVRTDATRVRAGRSAEQRRRSMAGLVMAAPAMLAVLAFFFVPLGLMMWMSLNDWPMLGTPRFIGLANFTRAFTDPEFRSASLFTVIYTLLITPILFCVGLGLALLVRKPRRGAGFFRTVYFMPVVMGLAAASYLWVWLVQSGIGPLVDVAAHLGFGDLNQNWLSTTPGALTVIIVMVTWKAVGTQMLLLMAGLQGIPAELEDAARVDGASRLQTLLYVFLPLLRPTLALVLVFGVGHSLLAFDQFYIMTGGGPGQSTVTAVYSIYHSSFVNSQLGYGAALSAIILVVLAVVSGGQMLLLRNTRND